MLGHRCTLLDALTTVTRADAEDYRRRMNCRACGSRPSPTPFPSPPSRPPTATMKWVVAAGRLHRVKRYDLLVRAFAQVSAARPDWRLRIYGGGDASGDEQAALRALIGELDLRDQVFLMGSANPMEAEWPKGSIAAVTSDRESFGMTIVEAMRGGLPVVATACPHGPAEIIEDGVDGRLVPVGDTDAIAAALLQLIEDDGLRHRMGRAALSASERFDPARIAESHESLFAELVARGARGRGHSPLRTALHRTRGTVPIGRTRSATRPPTSSVRARPPDRHRPRACGRELSARPGRLLPMLETSARLLRLLSLLQAHRDWSGADLAERLGVAARTVRRDVDKLRELGYPVNASPGTGGGYQLGAGAELPPLLLDDEEAVAVAVGLRTAAGHGIEGIGETSVRALAKLEQVLPNRLRRRVSALGAFTVPMLRGADTPPSTRPSSPSWPQPAGTASGSASPTAPTAAPTPAGPWSRAGSSAPSTAGTWSPGTWTGRTGGPSGWTGSPRPRRTAPGSHPGPRPPTTWPPTSPRASRSPPTRRGRCSW
ncbi:D-inositol-3-phosphate glycosyltransferase [Streptomyces microflavus]